MWRRFWSPTASSALICRAGESIGFCWLFDRDWINGTSALGYSIEPDARAGHATGAVDRLKSHAVDERRLRKPHARVFEGNAASERVLEKAGFREEGQLRGLYLVDGEYRDAMLSGWLEDQREKVSSREGAILPTIDRLRGHGIPIAGRNRSGSEQVSPGATESPIPQSLLSFVHIHLNMGASEQTGGAMTVSNNGVTVEKELVEDEFPIPTIRFLIVNERDDPVSVTLSETVPDDFTIASLGFHPDYESENWTCLNDENAEFVRDVDTDEEVETLYGIRIDDVDRASAFMTEPRIEDVQPVVQDADSENGETDTSEDEADSGPETGAGSEASADTEESEQAEALEEEPVTLSLNEDEIDPVDEESSGADADGNGEYGPSVDDGELPEGDIDLSGVEAPNDDSLHVEAVLGDDDPDIQIAVPTEPTDAGPEEGALVERLVEELQRADVDAEQKEALRDHLDLGVPSETRARIERLQDRMETLSAYTDSLEEFLDEDGTAQELLENFETQVEALRDDVATIRHHTRANASDVATLDGNIAELESHVDDVESRLSSVADHAAEIESSLAETDDHVDEVEADLADAADRIDDNEESIAALDEHLVEVDDDLATVEERVTDTEDDLDELDSDLDVVEERVSETEDDIAAASDRIEDNESEVEALQSATDDLEEGLSGVERRVTATEADALAHHDRLTHLEGSVGDLEDVTDDHDEDLSELEETTTEIRADLEETTEDIQADLEETAESLRSELDEESEAIRDDLDETSEDLQTDIEDIEDDVEELLTWRDELGEMFQ